MPHLGAVKHVPHYLDGRSRRFVHAVLSYQPLLQPPPEQLPQRPQRGAHRADCTAGSIVRREEQRGEKSIVGEEGQGPATDLVGKRPMRLWAVGQEGYISGKAKELAFENEKVYQEVTE